MLCARGPRACAAYEIGSVVCVWMCEQRQRSDKGRKCERNGNVHSGGGCSSLLLRPPHRTQQATASSPHLHMARRTHLTLHYILVVQSLVSAVYHVAGCTQRVHMQPYHSAAACAAVAPISTDISHMAAVQRCAYTKHTTQTPLQPAQSCALPHASDTVIVLCALLLAAVLRARQRI